MELCSHFRQGHNFQIMDASMSATLAPLILDFLEWLAIKPRPYVEVMEAWRTSCPRFTVWEDAVESGFIVRRCGADNVMLVDLTPQGRSRLAASGRLLPVT
jgi:hypothetical protein